MLLFENDQQLLRYSLLHYVFPFLRSSYDDREYIETLKPLTEIDVASPLVTNS